MSTLELRGEVAMRAIDLDISLQLAAAGEGEQRGSETISGPSRALPNPGHGRRQHPFRSHGSDHHEGARKHGRSLRPVQQRHELQDGHSVLARAAVGRLELAASPLELQSQQAAGGTAGSVVPVAATGRLLRGRGTVPRQVHTLEVVGSIPARASKEGGSHALAESLSTYGAHGGHIWMFGKDWVARGGAGSAALMPRALHHAALAQSVALRVCTPAVRGSTPRRSSTSNPNEVSRVHLGRVGRPAPVSKGLTDSSVSQRRAEPASINLGRAA